MIHRNRGHRAFIITLLIVLLSSVRWVVADASARLNDSGFFDVTAGASSDLLYVITGNASNPGPLVHATEANKDRGAALSRITVFTQSGRPTVLVATVTNRNGDSAYNAKGVYDDGGPGAGRGGANRWQSNYLTDGAQIQVQFPSSSIAPDTNTTATVTLANGQPNTNYVVQLGGSARVPAVTPAGTVNVDANPSVTLTTLQPTATPQVKGGRPGYLDFTATCSRASNSPVSQPVTVVAVDRIVLDGSSPEETHFAICPLNGSVKLNAMPNPAGSTWPATYPQWTVTVPQGSGVPTSGSGPSLTLSPDLLGDYVATAICGSSTAQFTVHVLDLRLKEMTYLGNGYHEVQRDPVPTGSTIPTGGYSSPHWQDNNADGNVNWAGDATHPADHNFPVCYTLGGKVKATVVVSKGPSVGLYSFKLRGTGPSCAFPATDMTVTDTTLSATIEASQVLGGTAGLTTYQISWEISLDSGNTWVGLGSTKNRMYVTLHDPDPSVTLYETVADLACRGVQETDPDKIVTAIWGNFKGLSTTRKAKDGDNRTDGVPLTYWATHTGPNQWQTQAGDVPSLLQSGDGSCGAWADLLLTAIQVHGIGGARMGLLTPGDGIGQGILVREFTFQGSFQGYGYVPGQTVVMASGIRAQNNANPQVREFGVHKIVSYNSNNQTIGLIHYDPSYGLGPYTSLTTYGDDVLAGLTVGINASERVKKHVSGTTDVSVGY